MASTSTVQIAPEQTSQQVLPERKRRWEDLALVLFIGFLPLVIGGIYQLFFPITVTPGATNVRFCTGLVHEAGALFLFGVLLRRQGRKLSDVGISFRWMDVPTGFALAIGSWIFTVLFSAWISLVYFWSGSQLHFRDATTIFAGALPALFLLYTMAAPFFEETLIKGYLMTELIGLSCPVWLVTLASVVLQTSYHLYYGFVGALVVGSGFAISAIYFAKTRRLIPVILSHLFWNMAASYSQLHR